jgi:diaminohydroxyphosphoribosylaminopyrimidine deaminase/5-amino-6-(5-phosphoribosylamino)uracil reductase
VGAVIVKNGKIISKGCHRCFGQTHAEIEAIEKANTSLKGSTLYVNLEPCLYFEGKKTPACTDRIIKEKIKKVVVGMIDPNPKINGKGIQKLRNHGIDIEVGILEEECKKLNECYLKFITTGMPYILVKIAQTLDGKIATITGDSQWITSASRKFVHKLRDEYDAVLVGIGTIIADNPQLTVRLVKGRNPYRIILDSSLKIPIEANVLNDETKNKTIIVTTENSNNSKIEKIISKGANVWKIESDNSGRIDIEKVFKKLGENNIISVLVEGGSRIFTSLLERKLFDKLIIAIAPKIIGKGLDAIGDLKIEKLNNALTFKDVKYKKIGDEILFEGRL